MAHGKGAWRIKPKVELEVTVPVCPGCGVLVPQPAGKRVKVYCSRACSSRVRQRTRGAERKANNAVVLNPASAVGKFVPWTGYGVAFDSLVVAAHVHPSARGGLAAIDFCEMFDAAHEDEDGNLPFPHPGDPRVKL